jgi:large subunit ribosomal protein L9
VQRVLKERGHDIERKRIELKGTIKEIGTYEVPVHVHPQVVATVTVEVVDEEGKVSSRGRPAARGRRRGRDRTELAAEALERGRRRGPSDTDTEALAEQALEAAEEFEQQQAEKPRRPSSRPPTSARRPTHRTTDEEPAEG